MTGPAVTVFENTKRRTRVTGRFGEVNGILKAMSGAKLDGYEIHMGETIFSDKDAADHKMMVQICDQVTGESRWDGAQKKNVYGCYVHGIFDDREVADALIGALLEEKGYGEEAMHSMDYHAYKEKQYQILANAVRENMDMKKIYEIIEKGNAAECFI